MLDANYRVLVTGACGSIGEALVGKLLENGNVVCAYDNNENGLFNLDQKFRPRYNDKLRLFVGDIRDKERLIRAFEGVNLVFHCAALKHVYLSEYNPFEAMQTNISGTNNVIDAAILAKVDKVVYTSSDKAVNPTSTMGATKLLGEKLITAANHYTGDNKTKFSSVRFGNVLNTSGSVLQIFKDQIQRNQSLTITSENMTRFFLSISHALELCFFAASRMLGGEIFVKNMGSCSIISLAKAVSGEKLLKYNLIGYKSGEKLYEELVTDNEAERTASEDNWYMILPDTIDLMSPDTIAKYAETYGKPSSEIKCVRSDINLLSDLEVSEMLQSNGLL